MRDISALLQNKSDIWSTPKEIYNFYLECGYFDPCPINPNFDGLSISWKYRNFVNPPYSDMKRWVIKCIEEMKKGNEIVLLVPARTDTQWFKKLYINNAKFMFIEGRLKFGNSKNSAPFPSMLVRLCSAYKFPCFDLYTKHDMLEIYDLTY